ncbi:hypothetical protein OG558_37360 [Kribbella sp. NBC_01510]|uniref:hypothetical protein n=1 Tax=Kribbella sp. NBC_01510 TaxID=2903581 RepID=UPI003869BA06
MEDPPRPGPGGWPESWCSVPTADIRDRDYWDKVAPWVSACADVGHSLTRSVSCRVVVAVRRICGIALL